MVNHIEIKIDCIHSYDSTVPDDIILEHLLNYYRHYTKAILYAVSIEVGIDDELYVTRNGYFIDIAKTLGITKIRAAIINGSEHIMKSYNDCILNQDLVETYENESKIGNTEIYKLVYFSERLSEEEFASINSLIHTFLLENKIEPYSIQVNRSEKYIVLHLKSSKLQYFNHANALFVFLRSLNDLYKISTLNGVKIERYLP
ncbi:MAG: hypothetical protein V4722_18695 [Bacteroidota bacterium]